MRNRLTKIIAGLLLILVLFVVGLPSLLSISTVNKFLLSCVNHYIPGKIYAEELSLGWMKGFSLKELEVHDPHGLKVAQIKNVSVETPLYSLFSFPNITAKVAIDSPQIALIPEKEKGHFTIEHVLQASEPLEAPQSSEPDILISDLHCIIDIQPEGKAKVELDCLVETNEKEKPGSVHLDIQADNILDLKHAYNEALNSTNAEKTKSRVDLNCKIDDFPVQIAQTFMSFVDQAKAALLVPAIGKNLDAKIEHSLQDGSLTLFLQIQSPQLSLNTRLKASNSLLDIQEPIRLTWKMSPSLLPIKETATLKVLIPKQSGHLGAQGQMPLTMSWAINEKPLLLDNGLSLLVSGEIKTPNLQKGLQASIQVADVKKSLLNLQSDFSYDLKDDRIIINPTTLSLNVSPELTHVMTQNSLEATEVPFSFKVTQAEIPFDIASWKSLMSLNAKAHLDPIQIRSKGNTFEISQADLTFAKTKGQDLSVTSDVLVGLKPQQALLGPQLSFHADFPVVINPGKIALNNIRAKISSETIDISLDNLFATIIPEVTIDSKSKATINYKLKKGPFGNILIQDDCQIEASLEPFAISLPLKGEIRGQLTSSPLALGCAEQSLGAYSLQMPFQLDLQANQMKGSLDLFLQGEGLELKSSLQLGKELKGDTRFEWHVSPERFAALQKYLGLAQSEKQKEIKLFKPVTLKAHVPVMTLPLDHLVPLGSLLDGLQVQSQMSLSEIILAPKEGAKLCLAPLSLEARLIGQERKVDFTLTSEKSETKNAASVSIKGSALNLWDEQGIQLDKARILVESRIQNLPLDIIQSFSAKPETASQAVAVLGEKIDANLKGDLKDLHEGTFRGQIESPRFKSEVACLLKNGTLLLESPLTAEYTLTPEAGEVLLKDVNPLLVTAAHSQSPIKLWIDSKDFSIPLKPFSMKEMSMRTIKIEPGVLTCKNGGMLSLLVNLLKADTSSGKEVNLWFTPIFVEIKKGIVFCKRADALLADAFPIATWGTIDLLKNTVDMTLGLSGLAISRAFDIETIDPDYLLQIPIRGNTQSPKIDTVRATAKITALKMQQNKSNTAALLGGLLEVATSVGEKDELPPAPTTYPFPWQGQVQSQSKENPKEQKKSLKKFKNY